MSQDKLNRVFNTTELQEFRTRLENAANLCRADNQELALGVLHRGMMTRGQDPHLSNEANLAGLHLAQLNDLMNEGVTQFSIPVIACLEVSRRILSPDSPVYPMFA